MSRSAFRPTPLSLTLTILLGTAFGAGTALLDEAPEPLRAPVLQVALDMPRPGIAGESLELSLEVTNLGPGDVQAPLDGVLSLEVLDLSSASATRWPAAYLANGEVVAPSLGPLVLPEGETATSIVRLPALPPLDRAGSYLLRGELYGPAGVLPVAPLRIDVEPVSGDLAMQGSSDPCAAELVAGDLDRAAC